MANILDKYGIKEVADVTFYKVNEDGSPGSPALYLDTLKVSTIEQTAEQADAKGGKGNPPLVVWDYGKEINVTLEDALFSMKSLETMWGDGTLRTLNGETDDDAYLSAIHFKVPALPEGIGSWNVTNIFHAYFLATFEDKDNCTQEEADKVFPPILKYYYPNVDFTSAESIQKAMYVAADGTIYNPVYNQWRAGTNEGAKTDNIIWNLNCNITYNNITYKHNIAYVHDTSYNNVKRDGDCVFIKEDFSVTRPTEQGTYNASIAPGTEITIFFFGPKFSQELPHYKSVSIPSTLGNKNSRDEELSEGTQVKVITCATGAFINSSTISITPNNFPGVYYVVGDTYARSAITGDDEFFQFIIPKAKVQSENTLTMEAEGDPSVFSMNLRVLRPASGAMMKLVKYDLATETPTVDSDSNSNVSGPSQAQAQGSDNNDPVDPDPEPEEDPEGE